MVAVIWWFSGSGAINESINPDTLFRHHLCIILALLRENIYVVLCGTEVTMLQSLYIYNLKHNYRRII